LKFYKHLILLAIVFSNCSLFESSGIVIEQEPVVTLSNFVEIKEDQSIDEYGLHAYLLTSTGSVKKNESIYTILNSFDVEAGVIQQLDIQSRGIFESKSIKPGQKYLVYRNPNTQNINRFILHLNLVNYIVFDWSTDVNVFKGAKEIEKVQVVTEGVITSSLYEALQVNGDNPILGNKLSDIFGWQVDFFNLKPNDSYSFIYEQRYVEGEPFGIGEIIAANFSHNGTDYDAYYFETHERSGYFNQFGESIQKALLKAPFKYSQRISSGYSHSRFHPVLKKRMPHYGIDYAAPLGTPVISVGDGVVIEARYRGANGNIVKIKHNSTYTTAYLHLNGFAQGIRPGTKVKQGQTIGYVGRTGRVTGVHLDYRIYKNNQPVNPLNIEIPSSEALKDEDLASFKLYIERYKHLMRHYNDEMLAQYF
jgi:murein DD-endopeptidase MepM/ murein hydrolase activator NlpD